MPQINDLIKSKGLKKAYILEQLGLSAPTFKKRLEDPSSFTIREIKKLRDILGTNIDIDEIVNFFCG